jgi:hypothetical protein
MDYDRISWRGKPLTALTREQLMQALSNAYHRINQLRDERDALDRKHLNRRKEG